MLHVTKVNGESSDKRKRGEPVLGHPVCGKGKPGEERVEETRGRMGYGGETPLAWKVNEPLKEREMLVTPSSSLASLPFSPMYI